MPLPPRNQSFLGQIRKQFTMMRRQRPFALPAIIIAAIVICCMIYVIVPSSQSPSQVLTIENSSDLPDLKLHSVRKSLANEPRADDEPVIDEKALSDALKKSLEQARQRRDDIPNAALLQLQSELDAAIAAKRFERCVIIRDVMQAIEKQIADKVVVTESVDDYIGRIEHSLRSSTPSESQSEQSNQPVDQSNQPTEEQPQQESDDKATELVSLRERISAIEEETRIKHRVRMLANRAKNSRIKIGKLSHEDELRVGLRSHEEEGELSDVGVRAGVRSVDAHGSHEQSDPIDNAPAARAGIFANEHEHDEVGDRVGMKAGIHASDIDGNRHHRTHGFSSFEEAKQAAEAAKARRGVGRS